MSRQPSTFLPLSAALTTFLALSSAPPAQAQVAAELSQDQLANPAATMRQIETDLSSLMQRAAGQMNTLTVAQWSNAPTIENLGPTVNSPYRETGLSLSADGTMLFFASDRPGGYGGRDVWMSRRQDGRWLEPENLGPEVNSPADDGGVSCSSDGRTVYFGSKREGGIGGEDVYTTTYVDRTWTTAENLGPAVNSPANDGMTYIAKTNNSQLFFNSDRPAGAGGVDLWVAELRDATWQKAANLGPDVNTKEDEWGPFLANDGRTLLFSRGLARDLPAANERLFVATLIPRANLLEPLRFATPAPFGGQVNAGRYQSCQEISADGTELYFSSDRPGSLGKDDIWVVRLAQK